MAKNKQAAEVTDGLKEALSEVLVKEKRRFADELSLLSGTQFINKYIDILKFVLPTMSAQKVDTNMAAPIQITFNAVQSRAELESTIPIDDFQKDKEDE